MMEVIKNRFPRILAPLGGLGVENYAGLEIKIKSFDNRQKLTEKDIFYNFQSDKKFEIYFKFGRNRKKPEEC
jgi:hypothetical protein